MSNYNSIDIAHSFIQYFYDNWITNPQELNSIINKKSKLKYNNIMYESFDIVNQLYQLKTDGLEIILLNHQVIDSNSRQIYILVSGTIKNIHFTKKFTQSFVLMRTSIKINKWNIINSILIIE